MPCPELDLEAVRSLLHAQLAVQLDAPPPAFEPVLLRAHWLANWGSSGMSGATVALRI